MEKSSLHSVLAKNLFATVDSPDCDSFSSWPIWFFNLLKCDVEAVGHQSMAVWPTVPFWRSLVSLSIVIR